MSASMTTLRPHTPARAACRAPIKLSRASPATHSAAVARVAVRPRPGASHRAHRCRASSSSDRPVYQGRFGEWSVDSTDVLEVNGYRASLNLACACAIVQALRPFVPEGSGLAQFLANTQDIEAFVGTSALGVALLLIHVYVTPLKRAIQVMCLAGLAGGAYLAATHEGHVVDFVASHPWGVWFVGPAFAAFTGVALKEGFCYGKAECGALTLLTPVLLLGHLSGLAPANVESAELALWAGLLAVFAGRKWTQRIEDDIGDKSIFEFMKLPEEEQERRLRGSGADDW